MVSVIIILLSKHVVSCQIMCSVYVVVHVRIHVVSCALHVRTTAMHMRMHVG